MKYKNFLFPLFLSASMLALLYPIQSQAGKKLVKETLIEEVPSVDTLLDGKLTNLGPQVTEASLSGAAFVITDKGMEMAYTVVTGSPARLLGFDLKNGKLLVNLPMRNLERSWSLTVSTDGWLYIAGAGSGRVCKHWPGSQLVEDLGKPLSSQSYVWEVVAGKDGEIFGGTYPGGRGFRYHPNEGFSDIGGGAIVPGEKYVRKIGRASCREGVRVPDGEV